MAPDPHSPEATDPPLLRDNSSFKSFASSSHTYPGIRVFYRKHPRAGQLPTTPAPLPLLVFIHGLGGSVAQFHPLLTSLVHLSSCLAIDLPGCGRSEFSPTSWDAYSHEALAELLEVVIASYRDEAAGQGVVLIGHSMGTALAARIANKRYSHARPLADAVVGLIAICPISGDMDPRRTSAIRTLLWIPEWIFDLWRAWDRRGGPDSASVKRFVGPDADLESKKLQDRFNNQSRTPVWRRMVWGIVPVFENGAHKSGMPGLDVWRGLDLPVFLVGGESDNVTPPAELEKVAGALAREDGAESDSTDHTDVVPDSAAPVNVSVSLADHLPETIEDIADKHFERDKQLLDIDDAHADPSTPSEQPTSIPPQSKHPKRTVKTLTMPAPANHALLYMPTTVRILAGLISDFLSTSITPRLSLGWQLQYLSREGKWDVKNLAKWKGVAEISSPIGPADKPIFRAMKTLREADESHCPPEFVKRWGGTVKDIIDISHDQPVYDPRSLERGGVRYHKFATVSKIPPTDAEVNTFVALVDRIRKEQEERGEEGAIIGVHCHYGFNRTGYFIVCYLVERCGFGVQDAIDAFATARPNGIRHSHFLDQLFVRYCLGDRQEAQVERVEPVGDS